MFNKNPTMQRLIIFISILTFLFQCNLLSAKEYRITIKGKTFKNASIASEAGLKTTVSGIQEIFADKPEQIILELQDFFPFEGTELDQTVVLNAINLLSPDAKIYAGSKESDVEITTSIPIYRGKISDSESVNLCFTPGGIVGNFQIADNNYTIKPEEPATFTSDNQSHLVQMVKAPDCADNWCQTDVSTIPDEITELMAKSGEPQLKSSNLTPLTIEIALETNYKTYESFGKDSLKTAAHLLSVIAGVSKIYEDQVNVNLKVVYMKIWTTPNDPYTGNNSTVAGFAEILNALKSKWENDNIQVNKDAVIFISSQLNGGISFLDGLCTQNNSYFIGSDEVHLIAHELGHLIGSPHTHNCSWPVGPNGSLAPIDFCYYVEGDCENENVINTEGTLMSYCSDRSNLFHPVVKAFIRGKAELKTCISSIPSATYTIKGSVKDGEKGIPNVLISPGDGSFATTDTNGYFSIQLPSGRYYFTAYLENYSISPIGKSKYGISVILAASDLNNINFTALKVNADQFESDNLLAEAKEIIADGSIQQHTFHFTGDIDFLKFNAVAGQTYLIYFHGDEGKISPTISLFDSNGSNKIIENNGTPFIEWKASESATYYLKTIGRAGNYGISIGNNPFKKVVTNIPRITDQATDWCDFDQDGDFDIVLSGVIPYKEATNSIFINNNNQFIQVNLEKSFKAKWCDFNNDGNFDIVDIHKIITNQNNGWQVQGVFEKSLYNDWGVSFDIGDIDKDGDMDIVTQRHVLSNPIIFIYYNENGVLTENKTQLSGANYGKIKLVDFDLDGDQDIVLAGSIIVPTERPPLLEAPTFKIYENNAGIFTEKKINIEPVFDNPDFAFADFDNDGDLDLAISGKTASGSIVSKIYQNENGIYMDIKAPLTGCRFATMRWFDDDNDGDLDLMIAGRISYDFLFKNGGQINNKSITKIYQNKGNNVFEEAFFNSMLPEIWGEISVLDFDNDNSLDISYISKEEALAWGSNLVLMKNESSIKNSPPIAPANLKTQPGELKTIFSWSAATDDKTPSAGLTYNLRIGTSPGKADILSPLSNLKTGKRLVVNTGNAGYLLNKTIINLKPGTYYWSVQSIDNSYVGSEWAPEQTFTVKSGTTGLFGLKTGENEISVYPNPTTGEIFIEFGEITQNSVEVTVMNLNGATILKKQVNSQTRININLLGQAAGVYFVNLNNGNKSSKFKIVLLDQ